MYATCHTFLLHGSVLMVVTLQLLPPSLHRAAHPKWLPDKVQAGPGVPPPTSFWSMRTEVPRVVDAPIPLPFKLLVVSPFVSEGIDPSTMYIQSLLVTWWKTWLNTSWAPVQKSARWSCWMLSCFLDVAALLGLSPLYRCCILVTPDVSSQLFAL
jgi:hypothetical protein